MIDMITLSWEENGRWITFHIDVENLQYILPVHSGQGSIIKQGAFPEMEIGFPFMALIDAIPCRVIKQDRNGRWIDSNPRFLPFWGWLGN